MGKLYDTSEAIVEFIENIIDDKTTLSRYITWKILSDEKQKELIKIVKASATNEFFGKMRDAVIIYVNEEIFDALAPANVNDTDYRALVIEDALAGVEITENDKTGTMKISIAKPAICITGDGYSKYGEDLVHAAEAASIAFVQIQERIKAEKEMEKERKRAAKEMKKNSGNGTF